MNQWQPTLGGDRRVRVCCDVVAGDLVTLDSPAVIRAEDGCG